MAIRYEVEKNTIIIVIKNQGEGIVADALKRLTDPFFTTRREQGGTGLGLAISDRIVKDHGGTMNFESKPGTGTRVRVTLPLAAKTDLAEAQVS